jgi:hypothetical protein
VCPDTIVNASNCGRIEGEHFGGSSPLRILAHSQMQGSFKKAKLGGTNICSNKALFGLLSRQALRLVNVFASRIADMEAERL